MHKSFINQSLTKFENVDKDIWLSKDDTTNNTNPVLMKEQSSSNLTENNGSIPMEFIQVLIHQHARTLVALQDLQREVTSLKSLKPPMSTTILQQSTSSSHSQKLLQQQSLNTCCCWLQQQQSKLADSGFSTETKSNKTKTDFSSEEEDNELYSLLSLIQYKVQSLNYNKKPNTIAKPELGILDNSLGNNDFDFKKFKLIDKSVISSVLNCNDKVELRRQLLFLAARLKTIEQEQETGHQPSTSSGSIANQSLLRALEALKSENEQLRFKLQEMEIELEGTNAKLRILSRSSNKQYVDLNCSLSNNISTNLSSNTISATSSTNLRKSQVLLQVPQSQPPQQQQQSNSASNIPAKTVSPEPLLNSKNKSLSSISSSKSLIPVPVARLKKKNNSGSSKSVNKFSQNNSNFWAQWFG